MNHEMNPRLAAAVANLTATQRRALAAIASRPRNPGTEWLDELITGLAAQVRIDEARADAILAELEAEHRAEVDAIDLRVNGPLPTVDGRPAIFDPETGEWDFA